MKHRKKKKKAHRAAASLKARARLDNARGLFSLVTGGGSNDSPGGGLAHRFSFMTVCEGAVEAEDWLDAVDEVERLVLRLSRMMAAYVNSARWEGCVYQSDAVVRWHLRLQCLLFPDPCRQVEVKSRCSLLRPPQYRKLS